MSQRSVCLWIPSKMATVEAIPGIESFVRSRIVHERKTHQQVSDELIRSNPGMKGLSTRSVRRFCEKFGIHASSRLSNSELDRVVSSSVSKVR